MLDIPISEGWTIILPRLVIKGLNLSDKGDGGSVEHLVVTLLDRMQSRMADRAVWTMRAFHGQVAGVGACRTKESLPKLGFFLGW